MKRLHLLLIFLISTFALAKDFKGNVAVTGKTTTYLQEVNGTSGEGYIQLDHQSSDPGTPGSGSNNIRLYGKSRELYYVYDDGAGTPVTEKLSDAVTNPMDSVGDMIVGGSSPAGVPTKLDSGTSGYLLEAAGAASPIWKNKEQATRYTSKEINNANYTVLDDDGYNYIYSTTTLTADITVTLPTAADNTNRIVKVAKLDSSAYKITLKGEAAGETINGLDGSVGVVIYPRYVSFTVLCNGSVWFIVDAKVNTNWAAWTPVSSWDTNVTITAYKKRSGPNMDYSVKIVTGNSPATGALTITLPTPEAISTNVTNTAVNATRLGDASIVDTGTTSYPGSVLTNASSSVVKVASFTGTSTANVSVSTTSPFTFANLDTIVLSFSVPISGFDF